jgi:hypothetical protein
VQGGSRSSKPPQPYRRWKALRESLSRYVDVPEGRRPSEDCGSLRRPANASVTDFASRGDAEPSLGTRSARVEWTRVPELVMEDADGGEVVLEPLPVSAASNVADRRRGT